MSAPARLRPCGLRPAHSGRISIAAAISLLVLAALVPLFAALYALDRSLQRERQRAADEILETSAARLAQVLDAELDTARALSRAIVAAPVSEAASPDDAVAELTARAGLAAPRIAPSLERVADGMDAQGTARARIESDGRLAVDLEAPAVLAIGQKLIARLPAGWQERLVAQVKVPAGVQLRFVLDGERAPAASASPATGGSAARTATVVPGLFAVAELHPDRLAAAGDRSVVALAIALSLVLLGAAMLAARHIGGQLRDLAGQPLAASGGSGMARRSPFRETNDLREGLARTGSRVQAEAAALEERVRLAERAAQLGFFEYEFQNAVIAPSGGLCELLGLAAKPGLRAADSLLRYVVPEDASRAAAHLDRLVKSRAPQGELEVRVRREDGGVRTLLVAGRLSYAHDGTPERVAGIAIDVTERHLVAHHIEDLARRRDRYLAALARELRSPLAPLRNALAVLKASPSADETAAWAAELMTRQIDQLVLKVDHLVDLSGIASNRIAIHPREASLQEIVDGAAQSVRSLYAEREVALAVRPVAARAVAYCDPERVRQALAILLANACRRSAAGKAVDVSVEMPGGALIVAITDTGRTLSAAEIERLGETANVPEDKSDGGLEVGLPLAFMLLKLNDGGLQVSSLREGGVRWAASLRREGAPSRDAMPEPASSGVRKARVLIADDSKDTANSAARVLVAAGHEVAVAYDGAQVVRMAREFEPEFVLLDLSMPEKTGYEAAREIREASAARAPVLVAITGWADPGDRARALAAGFDHHFAKPVDPQRLLALIARHRAA